MGAEYPASWSLDRAQAAFEKMEIGINARAIDIAKLVWGGVLIRSRNWIIGVGGNPFGFWWVWIPATLALVVYGIAWNLVGEGLNDALNPRR